MLLGIFVNYAQEKNNPDGRILKLDDEYADTKSTLENHINELSGLVRILQTKNQNAVDHGKFLSVFYHLLLTCVFPLQIRKFLSKKQAFDF
ncbi:unnamed protein product [Dibothriocephalus latus]|uniref:Uncharacterized protein n=1 Tax=Dibothriocephalus latus TaxID=60516 RepID=A0A3P7NSQ9_DIBLA|nr:unnamed protein product [Dibothriocephalus latus]